MFETTTERLYNFNKHRRLKLLFKKGTNKTGWSFRFSKQFLRESSVDEFIKSKRNTSAINSIKPFFKARAKILTFYNNYAEIMSGKKFYLLHWKVFKILTPKLIKVYQ